VKYDRTCRALLRCALPRGCAFSGISLSGISLTQTEDKDSDSVTGHRAIRKSRKRIDITVGTQYLQ
jgi:hypothetical protein